MLEEKWLLEKKKKNQTLNSQTVVEIEEGDKKSFYGFSDSSPRRKIYLTWVNSKIS